MACGNNMVSRSGLQSAPVSISMPSGPGPARHQPAPQQVAVVQQQARTAMDQAERKASAAATPSAARDAVKDAQRALDAARQTRGATRGAASARASLVRELERKLDDVKRKADAVTGSYLQREQASAAATSEAEVRSFQAADRLNSRTLGVPARQVPQPSMPLGRSNRTQPPQSLVTDPALDAQRQAIVDSLPLPIASDLAVERVEQLNLDHPLAPSDLKPNTAYVYGENVYVTDANGDPAYTRGIAKYVPDAPRHAPIQRQVGHDGQAEVGERFGKLVGGHMGGVSLGGWPSAPNLFAQNTNMNVSAFAAAFETQVRELAKKGDRVEYEVRLAVDSPDDKVASVAILHYWVNGVDQGESPLLNEPHQFR